MTTAAWRGPAATVASVVGGGEGGEWVRRLVTRAEYV